METPRIGEILNEMEVLSDQDVREVLRRFGLGHGDQVAPVVEQGDGVFWAFASDGLLRLRVEEPKDAKGKPNPITISWTSLVSHEPLMMAIAVGSGYALSAAWLRGRLAAGRGVAAVGDYLAGGVYITLGLVTALGGSRK